METINSEKSEVKKLVLLMSVCYFLSYLTRLNYAAVISEMASTREISKSLLSIALSASSVTYGIGQLLSGVMGDKIQPKLLIFSGIIISALSNLLVTATNSIPLTVVIWGINGFAQSLIWPPMVKIMTVKFSTKDYLDATVTITAFASLGTITVYLCSPLLISLWGWKSVFITSALLALAYSFVVIKKLPKINGKAESAKTEGSEKPTQKVFSVLLCVLLFAILMQGSLRDAILTWTPSIISETYHLSNSISILSTIVLPVFAVFCLYFARSVFNPNKHNLLSFTSLVFLISGAASLAMLLLFGKSAILTIVFMVIINGAINITNLALICYAPAFFKKTGKTSFVSGLLNSFTYVGSSISVFGFAKLTENSGWNRTILIWVIISLAGSLVCLLFSRKWKREMQ